MVFDPPGFFAITAKSPVQEHEAHPYVDEMAPSVSCVGWSNFSQTPSTPLNGVTDGLR